MSTCSDGRTTCINEDHCARYPCLLGKAQEPEPDEEGDA